MPRLTARRALIPALCAFAVATPAGAQFGPQDLGAAPLVEELIVTAPDGPPWWTVKDADSTVYIFITPGGLPAGTTFDQRRLQKRIAGSREVILPPTAGLDISAIVFLPRLNRLMKDLNDGQKRELEPKLPEDLRRRFVAQREKAGRPETRYGALSVGLAALALDGDVHAARRPAGRPGTTVEAVVATLAKKARVKARPAKTYGGPTLGAFLGDLDKPGLPCMVSVLDDLERPPRSEAAAVHERAVRAWAEGDVRPLIAEMRSGDGRLAAQIGLNNNKRSMNLRIATPACFDALATVRRVGGEWNGNYVTAIHAAMKKKGQAVAIVDAGSLLVRGGVLDQLIRRGYQVTAPDAAEE